MSSTLSCVCCRLAAVQTAASVTVIMHYMLQSTRDIGCCTSTRCRCCPHLELHVRRQNDRNSVNVGILQDGCEAVVS